ncbi:bifunctional anthranilate synthase component II/anthranilate phosphoribosyltransferase [Methanocella arvoryzae]|uniref:Anthranilate phosphoribosyltransferase n=1 Tax=Methanocella arvoryzae (strain DSM 22066 / NBRC 105507 / MRE50) TaxID=351160 RepID=Q0W627_METAR|nr:bifunctional anthranilate synthase component II/anthranilate phosphoribosyltransferase [Methanocella arvoryzae]CAJ36166.1 anthranilate synthase, component II (including glutamine amidotransferase, EC 2.4.2.18) [Methanocella arvoryzae MRE50]
MKVVIVDNVDSFVYNLYQYVGELGADPVVVPNTTTVEEIEALEPDRIILSPGPGKPEDAGNCVEIIKQLGTRIPVLGVCLGHQCIGIAYGGTVSRAPAAMHGKTSMIQHDGTGIYSTLTGPIKATRYHSLTIKQQGLPECLKVTASADDSEIMGVRHKEYPIEGVQFHPESILTGDGKKMMLNFLYGGTMKDYIEKLVEGTDLTPAEATDAMRLIMAGKATPAQIGSFLTALRVKGESISDITSFALAMREFATRISPKTERPVVDMCGTGGDTIKTFNISTISSFVVAGAGVPVAKHGNRSVTSKSGSADILEALGAKIDGKPADVQSSIEQIGFGFMFAPVFHGSMKHAIGPRKEVGIRTVFNLLGPLTNPASAKAQLVGVYDPKLVVPVAKVLRNLGAERGMVVHGIGGLDEVSTFGRTLVAEIKDDKVITYEISPGEFGLPQVHPRDLKGGSAEENAQLAYKLLRDLEKGPKRDIVLLNAACGIYVGGAATSIKEALQLAADSIDSGRALAVMERYIELSKGAAA